jgi:hypothetical protein
MSTASNVPSLQAITLAVLRRALAPASDGAMTYASQNPIFFSEAIKEKIAECDFGHKALMDPALRRNYILYHPSAN